ADGLAAATTLQNTPITIGVTAAGRTFFPYLVSTAAIPVSDVWGYPATITDPTTTTALVTAQDGTVIVAHHVPGDGRDLIVTTIDENRYSEHGLLLEYGLLDWVSHGLFLGKRRVYLSAQIDDLFLDSDLYRADGSAADYTITGGDLSQIAAWQ